MNKLSIILALTVALLFSVNSIAKLKVDTLLETTTSWDGGNFYYSQGKAKIIVKKLVASDDQDFKNFHCHLTPLAAYVIKGSIEVVKKSGQTRIFKAEDAFVEVMNTWHAGRFSKGTEAIIFYISDDKVLLNIYAGDPKENLCK